MSKIQQNDVQWTKGQNKIKNKKNITSKIFLSVFPFVKKKKLKFRV